MIQCVYFFPFLFCCSVIFDQRDFLAFEQLRHRPAYASAQSDQRICYWLLESIFILQVFVAKQTEFLAIMLH